jgi:hypothetical protein
MELRPSIEIWEYFSRSEINGKPITGLQVASALADINYGYHISYSAKELLKDLDLIKKDGCPNKKGKEVISHYLHEKYHRNVEGVKIIIPKQTEGDK